MRIDNRVKWGDHACGEFYECKNEGNFCCVFRVCTIDNGCELLYHEDEISSVVGVLRFIQSEFRLKRPSYGKSRTDDGWDSVEHSSNIRTCLLDCDSNNLHTDRKRDGLGTR